MHQYFDLVDTIYIPQQIIKALQAAQASDQGSNPGEIEYQLGLCHVVGFGVERSYHEAIRLFSESAIKGFWMSRLILRRVATALGVELDPLIERSSLGWSDDFGNDTETFRQLLVPSPPRGPVFGTLGYQSAEIDNPTHVPADTTGDERLIEALKLGQVDGIQNLIQEVTDINFQLDSGESALHFAVFFRDSDVAAAILRAGGDVLQCTTADCEFSITGMHKQRIPSNVSPLVLTVLLDRVELLKMFLRPSSNNMDESGNEQTLVDLLAWGAHYQSADCVEFLCEQLQADPIYPFDQRGVNPLSYAVQTDFLFRLTLFTPYEKSAQVNTPPLIDRQLTIVKRLLDAGFPLRADESTGLNCLHIAAATSDVTLLNVLLKYRSPSKLDELEEVSPEGFSPLGISITRARVDAYNELVEAGSNLSQAWPEIGGHALHCCAMYPSAASSTIATQILKKHPEAVHARDRMWRTPLHCAAFRENSDIIQTLIAARADIAARDFDGYTPLGAAVSGRNKRAIRQICAALNSKRRPLISWTFTDPVLEVGWLTYSPLEQLFSPGTISPAREPEMHLEQNRVGKFGCCDHPFSQKSIEVLKVLLECYKHTTRLGVNFFEHMFFSTTSYSGLEAAVSMGNVEAVKLVLGSKLFKPDYRCLVLYAHNQRMVGASHIADEATRESMLDYLEDCQHNDFSARRSRRTTSWLSLLWKPYYLCYGNLEQKQWERASKWLWTNRWYQYRPLFLEFVPWIPTRWSLNITSFCIGWTFMTPMIVYFVKIHRIPRTECPRSRKIYAIVCFVMVSMSLTEDLMPADTQGQGEHLPLAPHIFSVLSVLYRHCRAQYHGHDRLLAFIQCSFSLFVAAGCCYLCYLLQPGQEMIFPDFALHSFTPQQISWIGTFGSLSQALEGVLIAVPA
jgi:ankyrin repeat protein